VRVTFMIDQAAERAILVAIDTEDPQFSVDDSLNELTQLCNTAGVEIAGILTQRRASMHPATYLGTGKLEELGEAVSRLDATCIVCDDELSPSQMRSMSEVLNTRIIDRTMLILDIFASHARSKEGNLQVELAQQRYRLTRLTGAGIAMSRLGGGIGTRGPGEKKLEVDRRVIRQRISQLREELKEIETHRTLLRSRRKENLTPQIAIVGYTNSGKSSLLNRLTDAGVLAENKLFATLDATTRKLTLPSRTEVLLSDTVGFISKLPHDLVEAFKSTLEEAKYADYLLHVVDLSNPKYEHQMHIVYETLDQLEVGHLPIITVYNKCDLLEYAPPLALHDDRADKILSVSAKTGAGIDALLTALDDSIMQSRRYLEAVIPYRLGGLINEIRISGQLLSEAHLEDGISIKAYVDAALYGKVLKLL